MKTSSYQRKDRINRQIMRVLAEAVIKYTEDPRLRTVNITRIEVTADLRLAKVYFTTRDNIETANKALDKAQGFFRSMLASRLKMRYTPELKFYYDDTLDQIEKIRELMKPMSGPENEQDTE